MKLLDGIKLVFETVLGLVFYFSTLAIAVILYLMLLQMSTTNEYYEKAWQARSVKQYKADPIPRRVIKVTPDGKRTVMTTKQCLGK